LLQLWFLDLRFFMRSVVNGQNHARLSERMPLLQFSHLVTAFFRLCVRPHDSLQSLFLLRVFDLAKPIVEGLQLPLEVRVLGVVCLSGDVAQQVIEIFQRVFSHPSCASRNGAESLRILGIRKRVLD